MTGSTGHDTVPPLSVIGATGHFHFVASFGVAGSMEYVTSRPKINTTAYKNSAMKVNFNIFNVFVLDMAGLPAQAHYTQCETQCSQYDTDETEPDCDSNNILRVLDASLDLAPPGICFLNL
jgi:hypothetical protein